MFGVGSWVEITDIADTKGVSLGEKFKVLGFKPAVADYPYTSSCHSWVQIQNLQGVDLGDYNANRFKQCEDPTVIYIEDKYDYVKCIDNKDCKHLTFDKVYKIDKSSEEQSAECIYLKNDDSIHTGMRGYARKRFVGAYPPEDWVELDSKIYGDHLLRRDIDQCLFYSVDTAWEKVAGIAGEKIGNHQGNYKFRCLKKDLPIMQEWTVIDPKKYPNYIPRKGDRYKNDLRRKYVIMDDISWKDIEYWCKHDLKYIFEIHRDNFHLLEESIKVKVSPSPEAFFKLTDANVTSSQTKEKEIKMKKETAIKAASVVSKFVGGLIACGYGYYHPDVVVDGIKSCLPTISIEAPAILQDAPEKAEA